jgi:hypothetical protein
MLSLPAVFMNMYVIAFGISYAGETFWGITKWLEVFFGLEILLQFI